MGRALILPDPQWPWEHKRDWKRALKIGRDYKPHEVVLLGDCFDFPSISKYTNHPDLQIKVKDHIDYGVERMDEISDYFPRAKIIFVEGNHDYRFEKFLHSVPQLHGLFQFEKLIGLDRRKNWKFVPYTPSQRHAVLGSSLIARHTPLGSTPKASLVNALVSHVYGHKHQIESDRLISLRGQAIEAFSPGWLGDPSYPVFHFAQNILHKWARGLALVETSGKSFDYQIVRL